MPPGVVSACVPGLVRVRHALGLVSARHAVVQRIGFSSCMACVRSCVGGLVST